jgi:hypothetical protein
MHLLTMVLTILYWTTSLTASRVVLSTQWRNCDSMVSCRAFGFSVAGRWSHLITEYWSIIVTSFPATLSSMTVLAYIATSSCRDVALQPDYVVEAPHRRPAALHRHPAHTPTPRTTRDWNKPWKTLHSILARLTCHEHLQGLRRCRSVAENCRNGLLLAAPHNVRMLHCSSVDDPGFRDLFICHRNVEV